MKRVFSAFGAVFVHFQTIGIVLFVFIAAVVSVFAFRASQSDFYAHDPHLLKIRSGGKGAQPAAIGQNTCSTTFSPRQIFPF
jgi:hypothetical protein